ncbi:MAG: GGDEF domain-containing protein [Marinobacter sp. 34-60-7]|nr:MAG: GGDEF domain-containing protein [Marinobacter sp. 34-60-7]
MTQTVNRHPGPDLSQYRVRGEIPIPALINGLSAAAVPLLLFYAWRANTLQQDAFGAVLLATFSALLAINALAYLITRHKTLQRRGFITLITVLFTYLATQGIEDGSAVIWLFAYPPIIFYISEAKVGIFACAGGWLALLGVFSPLGDWLFELAYSTSFRLSMLIVLAFEMVTCYLLDQSRRRSKLGLMQLAADFEHAAKHDALTGLANRREALEQLETEHQRFRRHQRPFSVLLLDIDLFKRVNDTYGHQAGDDMIKLVAHTLEGQSRKVDTVARWGGEEFLVLLPETPAAEAAAIAERIRREIAAGSINVGVGGLAISATVSIGVAGMDLDDSVDRLLQRADENLYRAKSAGRNQVASYPEPVVA